MKKLRLVFVSLSIFTMIASSEAIVYADYPHHYVADCTVCHYAKVCIETSNIKMIWDKITTPNSGDKTVIFTSRWGPNSFADGDETYDGVCEVCHTETKHHRNDGNNPDPDAHYAGTDCISCHKHFPDEFVHGGGAGCESCHGYDGGAGTYFSHSTHTENDSDDLKGPNKDCPDCHDTNSYPDFADGATDLAATTVCDSCHSKGGAFDGVDMAKVNWEGGIYEEDGITLKSGKENWCVTCHDQSEPETGTSLIDDFEGYTDDASLQANWIGAVDAYNPTLNSNGVIGQCMSLCMRWSKHTNSYGRVERTYATPYLDLSGMDSFNFYLKLQNKELIKRVKVLLRKAGTSSWCTSILDLYIPDSGIDYGMVDNVWKLIPLPRTSFDDQTFGLVDDVRIVFMERSTTNYTFVYLDEIGCDSVEPNLVGPNVVGDNVTRGYFVTGHKFYCTRCHDPGSEHIDGERYTIFQYIRNRNNPTNFRFYDDPTKQLQLPYNEYIAGPTGSFALCYRCHNEEAITTSATTEEASADLLTNFRDDGPMAMTHEHNQHYYHVVDTYAGVFQITCVLCHDPHGQSKPAMTRNEMEGFVSFDANGCEIEYGADSDGDGTMDRYDPDVNVGGARTLWSRDPSINVFDFCGESQCHNEDKVAPHYNDCQKCHESQQRWYNDCKVCHEGQQPPAEPPAPISYVYDDLKDYENTWPQVCQTPYGPPGHWCKGCHTGWGGDPPGTIDYASCENDHYDYYGNAFYRRTYKILPHTGGAEFGPGCFTSGCHDGG